MLLQRGPPHGAMGKDSKGAADIQLCNLYVERSVALQLNPKLTASDEVHRWQ